jgi:hypothetical protein
VSSVAVGVPHEYWRKRYVDRVHSYSQKLDDTKSTTTDLLPGLQPITTVAMQVYSELVYSHMMNDIHTPNNDLITANVYIIRLKVNIPQEYP